MKSLKSLSFVVLCLSLVTALAFKPAGTKVFATLFEFSGTTNGTDEFDPTKYSQAPADFDPAVDCPGTAAKVCAISTNEIYPAGTTPSTWIGKPKVNVAPLSTAISTALSNNPLQDPYNDGQGNVIYLKN